MVVLVMVIAVKVEMEPPALSLQHEVWVLLYWARFLVVAEVVLLKGREKKAVGVYLLLPLPPLYEQWVLVRPLC